MVRAEESPVLVERTGAVLVITLNRPEVLNAINVELLHDLLAALRAASADPLTRAVLLRGAGRAFCAGADRNEWTRPERVDPAARRAWLAELQELTTVLWESPKPSVATVKGHVVGAGLDLMIACDVTVAASETRFRIPELSLGVGLTGGSTYLLPHLIGLAQAKRLVLLREAIDAVAAARMGLVSRVTDTDVEAEAEGLRIAQDLTDLDQAMVAKVRSALHAGCGGTLAAALERELAIGRAITPAAPPLGQRQGE